MRFRIRQLSGRHQGNSSGKAIVSLLEWPRVLSDDLIYVYSLVFLVFLMFVLENMFSLFGEAKRHRKRAIFQGRCAIIFNALFPTVGTPRGHHIACLCLLLAILGGSFLSCRLRSRIAIFYWAIFNIVWCIDGITLWKSSAWFLQVRAIPRAFLKYSSSRPRASQLITHALLWRG